MSREGREAAEQPCRFGGDVTALVTTGQEDRGFRIYVYVYIYMINEPSVQSPNQ